MPSCTQVREGTVERGGNMLVGRKKELALLLRARALTMTPVFDGDGFFDQQHRNFFNHRVDDLACLADKAVVVVEKVEAALALGAGDDVQQLRVHRAAPWAGKCVSEQVEEGRRYARSLLLIGTITVRVCFQAQTRRPHGGNRFTYAQYSL